MENGARPDTSPQPIMNGSSDAAPEPFATRHSPFASAEIWLRALRVRQWAKNGLILAGFVFAGRLRQPAPILVPELGRVLLAVFCFCTLSAATYLLNDWLDLPRDRLHPIKRKRPLAAGAITLRQALMAAALLFVFGGAGAVLVWDGVPSRLGFLVSAGVYLVLSASYSLALKHEVIVDVLLVALLFVVRVVAGCLALPVKISPWIIFCTFALALFVSLCKRRAELVEMGEQAAHTRQVLPSYSVELLDTLIAVAAGLTIVAYSLYTFTASHSDALGFGYGDQPWMMITIPFVVYGVFRFLFLAHATPVGGEPEQLMRDRPMLLNIALWAVLVAGLTLLAK